MPKRRQPRRHRADSAKRREIAATTKPTQEFFDFHGDELGVDELEAQLLNQTIDSPFTSIDGHLDIDDGNGHQDHGEFEADELYLQALNSASLNDAIQLAKAAVELDPGHVDAWVLLGELAPTACDSIQYFDRAINVGREQIGDEYENLIDHFWTVLSTRPYMRALCGLANAKADCGKVDAAIADLQTLLRLNPNDNQGCRYMLAAILARLDRLNELGKLLRQFKEDSSTAWLFTCALFEFRLHGDIEATRLLLTEAAKQNSFVAPILLGQSELVGSNSEYVTIGSEDEAQNYAINFMMAWRSAPGAIAWLRKTLKAGFNTFPPDNEFQAGRPSRIRKKRSEVKKLAQDSDVWFLDVTPMPMDQSIWGLTLYSEIEDGPLEAETYEEEPNADDVWEDLLNAMLAPSIGSSRRPERIEFTDRNLLKALKAKLNRLDVDVAYCDTPPEMLEEFNAFSNRLFGHSDTLIDVEDTEVDAIDVWEVSTGAFNFWFDDDGETVRPHSVMVYSTQSEFILSQNIFPDQPSDDEVFATLTRAIQSPLIGDPKRPGTVRVRSADQMIVLKPKLEELGIRCEIGKLEEWDAQFEFLSDRMNPNTPAHVPLHETPGASIELIGELFESTSNFYKEAPWRYVSPVDVAEVFCREMRDEPFYTVIMGHMGMDLGLAIFDDADRLLEAMNSTDDLESSIDGQFSGVFLSLGEKFNVAGSDIEMAEQFGWPVASPEAYPIVARLDEEQGLCTPTCDDICLSVVAAKVVPEFLKSHQQEERRTIDIDGRNYAVESRRFTFGK